MESVMSMDLGSLGTKPLFPPLGVGHWTGGTLDSGAQSPEVSSSYPPGGGGCGRSGVLAQSTESSATALPTLTPPLQQPHWPRSNPSPLPCPARWLWAPFLQEQRQEEATADTQRRWLRAAKGPWKFTALA